MLHSKECPSLKHMVLKAIQKLTSCDALDEVEKDEDDDEVVAPTTTLSKVKTFANLVNWYSDVVMKTPLIIILQDLESFSTQQLQDFVLLCRYLKTCNSRFFSFLLELLFSIFVAENTESEVNFLYNLSWVLRQQWLFNNNFTTELLFAWQRNHFSLSLR